jgi:hypothetical protein
MFTAWDFLVVMLVLVILAPGVFQDFRDGL